MKTKFVLSSGSVYVDGRTCLLHIPFEYADSVAAQADFKTALTTAQEAKAKEFNFLGNTLNVAAFHNGHRIVTLPEWFGIYKMSDVT